MTNFIYIIVNGFIYSILLYVIGIIIFEKKVVKKRIIGATFIYILLFIISKYNTEPLLSVYFSYVLIIIHQKMVFKENLYVILISSLFVYVTKIISEYIFIFIDSECLYINFSNDLIFNISTALLAGIIILIFKKTIRIIIRKTYSYKIKTLMIIIFSNFILCVISFIKNPNLCFYLDYSFVIAIFSIIIGEVFGYFSIENESRINEIIKNYKYLADYSKTNEKLLEESKINLHENKNQLLIIKSMIREENLELKKYVESLLTTKIQANELRLNELHSISIPGIKGFLNLKMTEMERLKIKVECSIAENIKYAKVNKLNNKDLENLYSILGVLLDNAKEAAICSKEKIFSLSVYKEDNKIKALFANTYKGNVEIDKMFEYGYSSKGKKRGAGLSLIKIIMEKNPIYNIKSNAVCGFFIQELIIDVNKKTTKNNFLALKKKKK